MNYFTHCTTLEELKAEYKRLCLIHHPDLGGDTATMQAINAAYEEAFAVLKDRHNAAADESHQTAETPQEFIWIVTRLLHLDASLTLELCGSWIWISGDTRPIKEELKALHCRWSGNKQKWYWHPADQAPRRRRGTASMGEIRRKYGSAYLTAPADRRREIA